MEPPPKIIQNGNMVAPSSNRSTKTAPINPAPPVTTTPIYTRTLHDLELDAGIGAGEFHRITGVDRHARVVIKAVPVRQTEQRTGRG